MLKCPIPASALWRALVLICFGLAAGMAPAVYGAPTRSDQAIQGVTFTEFPVPGQPGVPSLGSDGNFWFGLGANQVARMTPAGDVTAYNLPANSQISRTTRGPDGAIWFGEIGTNRIGRITTAGAITHFAIPTPNSYPSTPAAGPDGAIWFTESIPHKIGRVTTAGVFTEFSLPNGSSPYGITAGPDGALWFTLEFGNQIGRMATSGSYTLFPIPTAASAPQDIKPGPDGALWFTNRGSNKIGRITTAGAITEYAVPTPNSRPWGIAAGPDGAMWFAEYNTNKIGRITMAGAITEYTVPTPGSSPFYLTVGADGAVWFSENTGNKLARINYVPDVDLSITKTSNVSQALPGQPVTYTLTYRNTSAEPAAGVRITDTLPLALANVSFTSSRPITAAPNLRFAWDAGTLAPNASGVITVTGIISPNLRADQTITNIVLISTIADDIQPGNNSAQAALTVAVPRIEAAPASVEEGGQATIRLSMTPANPFAPAEVSYASADGSATAGLDYAPISGTLVFPAATAALTLTLDTLEETLHEPDETVNLAFQALRGAALASAAPVTVTIVNDDLLLTFAPLVFRAAPIATLPVRLAAAIPIRPVTQQGEVFYQATASVNYAGGPVVLAGNAAGTAPSCVDDRMTLVVTRPDSSQRTFTYTCLAPGRLPQPLPPTDFSSYLLPGVNTIAIEFRDVYGSVVSSTELWLSAGQ